MWTLSVDAGGLAVIRGHQLDRDAEVWFDEGAVPSLVKVGLIERSSARRRVVRLPRIYPPEPSRLLRIPNRHHSRNDCCRVRCGLSRHRHRPTMHFVRNLVSLSRPRLGKRQGSTGGQHRPSAAIAATWRPKGLNVIESRGLLVPHGRRRYGGLRTRLVSWQQSRRSCVETHWHCRTSSVPISPPSFS